MADTNYQKQLEEKIRELEQALAASKRIEKEEPLRSSQANLQSLFDHMLNAFAFHKIITDDAGNPIDYIFLDVNPMFEKFTGLKKADILGRRVTEVHPGIEKLSFDWIGMYGKVALTGKSTIFEQYFEPQGHWYRISAYCPQKEYFAVTFENITERWKAETALKEKTEFLDKIIESSALSTWISDEKGTAIRANPASLAFFGASENEVVGKYNLFRDNVIEEQGFMPRIKRVFEVGEAASFMLDYDFGAVDHLEVKQASHKIVNSIFTPVLDDQGKVSNVIVQTIDLTDIKLAEEEVRENEAKFRGLVEISSDWIWEVDNTGAYTYASPQVELILGYRPEEILGKAPFDMMPPEEAKRVRGIFTDLTTKSKPIIALENINLHKDGRQIILETSGVPFFDASGNVKGYRGVDRDVTERKQAEDRLNQARKMDSIGTLAGGIAHEFNNILGIVLGNAELAMDDSPRWSLTHNFLSEIKNASLRGKDVVKQLLSFSRKDTKKKNLIDMAATIRESIGFLKASIPANIRFKESLSENCPPVLADQTQIHQVMINLCTNAAHAMENNGGTVKISLEKESVTEQLFFSDQILKPGEYVRLEISDTGHGIPDDVIKYIFDPFFTTKGIDKGTGMGLAVVYGIIKGHDGFINIKSTPGKGTTLRCYFPASDTALTETSLTDETVSIPKGTETLMFVDDDPSIAEIGLRLLQKLGYIVEKHTNPLTALALFKADPEKFDLVITDMTMPEMTGDHLITQLQKIRPGVRTIITTGFSKRVDEKTAIEIGAYDYIMKPFTLEVLARTVRNVLDSNK